MYYSTASRELSFLSVINKIKKKKISSFLQDFFHKKTKMNTSWTENTGIFNVDFKYTHNNLGNCLVENPAANVSTTG